MKVLTIIIYTTLIIFTGNLTAQVRAKTLFNFDWKFYKGNVAAQTVNFDDRLWRTIDLPQDFSIENLPNTHSPFDPAALSTVNGLLWVEQAGIENISKWTNR